MPQKQAKRKYHGQGRVKNYQRGGKQLFKDVMYLKALVNSESHYVYNSYTGQAISASGTIYHLSAISQNDTNYGRSGNSVLPRYLNMQVRLHAGTDLTNIDTVRMMIFRWKDNSTPSISDLFEDPSNPVYSPLNDNISGNTRDRQLDIIKSKLFLIGVQTPSNGSQLYKKVFDLNPPQKEVKDHIKFNNTATVDPLGGIYMLLIGRHAVTTATFEGSVKLSFHDN